MSLIYRKDIDGLRAIAVLSVLLYHLNTQTGDTTFLHGGFLGVDVFFVISGFLISGIILQETQAGAFSLRRFYERRIRRLFPTLLLVILVSLAAGFFILPATAFQHLAESAIASLAFVSNIYWFGERQVYGATSGLIAPLLHTWSLAIEEQFYLAFPIAFAALLKLRSDLVMRSLVYGFGIAFGVAVVLTVANFSISFYLPFSRIWELLFGVVIAYATHRNIAIAGTRLERLARFAPELGLFMILISIATADLRTGHPGFATVPVVLGTGLIILFAKPNNLVTRLLGSRPFVTIGLLSYALYLWHYPIFAYGRLITLMAPDLVNCVVWIALSLFAAWITHHCVEVPFGNRGSVGRQAAMTGIGAGTAGVLCLCVVLIAGQGMPERETRAAGFYGPANPDNQALRHATWGPLYDRLDRYNEARPTTREMTRRPTQDEATRLWFSTDPTTVKLLVVGDSHAKDMFNVLRAAVDPSQRIEVARFGMSRIVTQDILDDLMASPNFEAADVILLSFRYRADTMDHLPVLLDRLRVTPKTVAITTRMPEFEARDPFTLFDLHVQGTGTLDLTALEAEAWRKRTVTADHATNVAIRAHAAQYGFTLLDKEPLLCEALSERCAMATEDLRKIHFDHSHLTMAGAAHLGKKVVEANWLGPVFDKLDQGTD